MARGLSGFRRCLFDQPNYDFLLPNILLPSDYYLFSSVNVTSCQSWVSTRSLRFPQVSLHPYRSHCTGLSLLAAFQHRVLRLLSTTTMSDLSLITQCSNDPSLKPIIDPSCCRPTEKAARKNRFTSAFTAPKPAGSLSKKGDVPLGKTFRRTTSVERTSGPEVLPVDPRPDPRYGDGILRSSQGQRPSTLSAESSGSAATPSLWDRRASYQSTDASSILKSPQACDSDP